MAGTINCVLAFLVALFPERVKEREPFSRFRSNTAHFFSGLFECAFSLALFVYGYSWFVGGISLSASYVLAGGSSQTNISEAQLQGMGVLGFILYLLHPLALLSLYMALEGCVRAFTAALTGHCHGIAAFWTIDRIIMHVRTKRVESIHHRQLGPGRREFIQKEEPSGTLVLTSTDDKDWRERQVAQCGDDFYILSAKDFVQRGKYYRYQYTFRPMLPGEIIRGKIAVLPSITPRQ